MRSLALIVAAAAACVALALIGAPRGVRAQPGDRGWFRHDDPAGVERIDHLACSRSDVFAATMAGAVARWDGSAWTALPPLPMRYPRIEALAASPSGPLFAASGRSIARWDGQRWQALEADTLVEALWADASGEVYAASRGALGLLTTDRMRAFDAGTWRDLFAVWSAGPGDIFLAGQGGTVMHHDGSRWSRMPTGTVEELRGLWGAARDDVWAWSAEGVHHWDGRAWSRREDAPEGVSAIGGAAPDRVYALARDGAFVLTPTGWSLEIRRDALGTGYHSLAAVCATDREVAIVDRGWGVMLSAR